MDPDEIYKNGREPPFHKDPAPFDPTTTLVEVKLAKKTNLPTKLLFTVDVLLYKNFAHKAATSIEYVATENKVVQSTLMMDMITSSTQIYCYDEHSLNNQLGTVTWDLHSATLAKINGSIEADLGKCEDGSLVKFLNYVKRVNRVLVSLRYDKPLPTPYIDVKYRLVNKTGERL